jgi:hypothetical protein
VSGAVVARRQPAGGRAPGARIPRRVLARVTGGLALGLALAAPASAEPRGAYEQLIHEPLRRLLAPCQELADQCRARGEAESACRPRAEQCVRDVEERVREEAIREAEKTDPGARGTMDALDAQSACTKGILDCVRRAPEAERAGALGPCVAAARVCPVGPARAGAPGCCPAACRDAFRALVERGAAPVEAFARVFVKEPACFPGVPRPPR